MKRFAMITHFTGLNSPENFIYYPYYNFFIKIFPINLIKKCIPFLLPHIIVRVRNITSKADKSTEGYAIMCPLLPEHFFRFDDKSVLNKIIKSCRKAESLKVNIVGLAAFTSVVGNEGEYVSRNINLAVTSGNTYTAFLAIDSILKAINTLEIDVSKSKLVILGATGDIGSICTKMLAKIFKTDYRVFV